MAYKLLIINPGSTSTKIGIYEDETLKHETTIRHSPEELLTFENTVAQKQYRLNHIINFLDENHHPLETFDVFVGRGGLVKPVESGTYAINQEMIDDLVISKYGDHMSNMGTILAFELGKKYSKPAYMVDPVVVDEMSDIARISGLKGIHRISIFHALNQKAVAKKYAKTVKKRYEDLNLIVCHMGGGISVGYHHLGHVIDVNNAYGGDGPFSPERVGGLPTFQLAKFARESKVKNEQEFNKYLVSKGGLYSYLGTTSGIEIKNRINNGDTEAALIFEAMAYQTIKEIGSLYFIGKGEIDQVIFTGGLVQNEVFVEYLLKYLPKFVSYTLYPGEDELEALAQGALRVLNGHESLKQYKRNNE